MLKYFNIVQETKPDEKLLQGEKLSMKVFVCYKFFVLCTRF
jgi:hypothetical protein